MERSADIETIRTRLLSGSAWAFAARIATVLLTLAINAMVVRMLDPAAVGAYFLTVSLVAFFSSFAQLGLTSAVVRLVAESIATGKLARVGLTIRIVLRLGCGSGLVLAAVVAAGLGQWLAFRVFQSPLLGGISGLLALWIFVRTMQGLFVEIFRGFHDIRLASLFGEFLTSILCAIAFGVLWAARGQADLTQIVFLSVAAGATSTVLAALILRRRVVGTHDDRSISVAGILRIAWPLWVTNLVFFVVRQSDILIVGALLSQTDVALYGAASRMIKLTSLALVIVNAVLPPIIAELYVTGETRRLERITRTVATLACIPAVVVLAAFLI
ncbi:MAG: oligosaccharide flippase family protein, partial [Gammaproteobacteria bacterium]|nr:oligosaccharide flippase family protein [Gammaproteobacteria bacterium]